MAARVISALVFGFLFLALCTQSFWWVLGVFALLHVKAQDEFCGLLKDLPYTSRLAHVAGSTACFILLSLSLSGQSAPEMIAVLLMIGTLYYAIRAVGAYEHGQDEEHYIRLLLSLLLVSLPFAFCVAVASWNSEFPYLLLLIGASWGADTGAIFAGKFAGSVKLAPRVSPKKTVEGLIGGALSAAAVCAVAAWLYPQDNPAAKLLGNVADADGVLVSLPLPQAALLLGIGGFVLALLGAYGDLLFSMLKRESHIKDYGKIIAGHGGILDRFDSMLLVAPLVYLLAFI